ncbi:hypothetical protein DEA8626_04159 [Defluviimonas aquaemixtae]|uniref:Cytochrome c domain-containing protein n=1 Tax=Albidovulum aquaemixtae TaxID=1542388 RepID=A0A2R8BNU3_9RHOB|nr:hypothetical protein [Defluviimonas aquaemixtae]SPH25123.1 hypothetical protein DEA8626_04159 [Defluviimonas aquaemixtae]
MRFLPIAALVFTVLPTLALAEGNPPATIEPPAAGSILPEQGLAAFDRIYEVTSHPRCANCHVGADNVPMWFGGSEGPVRPHGMNINAGESRIGAETLLCSTCHRTSQNLESDPHAPPHAGLDWRLPPVEFQWFGRSASEVCAQLSDPKRTGGRDWMELAQHLVDDAGHLGFVLWGWQPGGGREPAPYSLQDHVNDVLAWGTAGQPCPTE